MKRQRTGVLALDLGTSSVRAVVYDQRGRLIQPTYADVPYQVDTTVPGQVSSDADQLVGLIETAIDRALKGARQQHIDIAAVGASCYWHSLMGIDRAGNPTTELLTWADTRSAPEVTSLRGRFDERAYHRRTGCYFHASFWPAKLRWLRRSRGAAVRRTAHWVSLAEYLYGRLFGEYRVSLSIASATGLFNVHRCQWDDQALRLAGVTAASLSPLSEWDVPCHGLRPPHAHRWPALAGVPWYLPLGDGALGNVGSGCLRPDSLCAMIGTSAALRVLIEARDLDIPWGAWAYRLDGRRWVLGGALSEGGNAIRWLRKTVVVGKRAQVEAAIAKRPPDGHGLTVLPFWAGERSPNWRGDARATLTGLSLATQPVDIVQATMEGISYQFGRVYRALLETIVRPRRVIASGGQLLHSRVWMQMLADVLEVPVTASPEPEASSRGAALLALFALGRFPRLWTTGPRAGRTFRPRPSAWRTYQAAQRRQDALYQLLYPPEPQPQRRGRIKSQKAGSSKPSRQTLTPRS
jgi:gluconokinase